MNIVAIIFSALMVVVLGYIVLKIDGYIPLIKWLLKGGKNE